MPQPYPNPSFNDTTGLISYVNAVTDGWATVVVSMCIPIVIFIIMIQRNYKVSDSFLVGFFLSFVISSFWWAAGTLSGNVVVALLLFTVGSSIFSMLDRD